MISKKTPNTENAVLHISPLKKGRLTVRIIGTTGLYYNSMSVKSKRQLIFPLSKTKADKASTFKHDPVSEFRDSVHAVRSEATKLGFPASGVKGAMVLAAMVTGGVNGTDVKRLVVMPQEMINVWGVPLLRMDVVRSADMNRTPDIRTRAFLPRWCAEVDIAFMQPQFSPQSIITLLSNAGEVAGLGDYRQEKGKGSFGLFEIVSTPAQEKEFARLQKQEGRTQQEAGLKAAECYDDDTRDLLDFVNKEMGKRQQLAEDHTVIVSKHNGAKGKRGAKEVADMVDDRHN